MPSTIKEKLLDVTEGESLDRFLEEFLMFAGKVNWSNKNGKYSNLINDKHVSFSGFLF